MTTAQRKRLAEWATMAGRESRRGGAPAITPRSSLAVLIAWHKWNDPNGEYDGDGEDGVDALDITDAWELIRAAAAGDATELRHCLKPGDGLGRGECCMCGGVSWSVRHCPGFMHNADNGHIERCDECGYFGTDAEAARAHDLLCQCGGTARDHAFNETCAECAETEGP